MISIHVLGAPVIRRAEAAVTGRAAHRRRVALLAILAAARGRPVGRERIVGLLWSEHPADAARHTLSEALYVLRKDLGEDGFVVVGDEVGLDPARVHCDVDVFQRALEEKRWEDAVAAYGGPFLDGFYVTDAPEFERWAETERNRLARAYGRALEELATGLEEQGAHLGAGEWWRSLLAHDAFSSRVALRLVRSLERAGERAAALRAAETHVLLLREELGVGPDPELTALMEELRRAPPPPAPATAAPATSAPLPSAPDPPVPACAVDDDGPSAPPAADPGVASAVPPVPGAARASDAAGSDPVSTAAVPARTDVAATVVPVPPDVVAADLAAVVSGRLDPPTAAPARRRRWIAAALGASALVLLAAAVGLAVAGARREPAPPAAPQYDARRIAVLYLDDDSPGGGLQYLANGLTEMLIHELSQVEALDVVSRNGVKPYRQGTVPFDSMVADLRVGSVVEGSVQRSADSVRVVVQLIDANSHSHLESRVVVRPMGEVLALQRAVSEEVGGFLRRRLGEQVRLRQAQAQTRSRQALDLVMRGEQAYADAVALRRSRDTADVASALGMLGQADGLLASAEAADPAWTHPTVDRAWVAVQGAQWAEGGAARASADSAVARAGRVLAREPANARALEARGAALWTAAVQPGARRGPLLERAERDLRAAVVADPSLASAWGRLSFVLTLRGQFAAADLAARRALEQDAYLEDGDELLNRRYYTALSAGDYRASEQACAHGRRVFSRDWRFVECSLTLLRWDTSRPPDAARAWRLVAELEGMDPPAAASAAGRAYAPVYRRVAAAAVSARAGDAGRARAELARARVDAAVDPETRVSLAYDEAVVLLLLGERAAARARLRVYLAHRPALRSMILRDPIVGPLLTSPGGGP
ncbi:MAG TPA: BTAD domain-containing putative transcriptional regulator [Longimicrobium sp.]|nr:BTAD domain-containing putative transcriptional regulator [Longimicrobium sp.]